MNRFNIAKPARLIPALTICLLLGACSVNDCESTDCAPDTDSTTAEESTLIRIGNEDDEISDTGEPVQSIAFDGEQVTFEIISNGCTVADHFHIEHEIHEGNCAATLIRHQADLCRRAPLVAELSLPWQAPEACATNAVSFTNPIVDLADRLSGSTSTIRIPRPQ